MNCGIVDLGSNTIRLSIYQWEGDTYKLLLNKKTMAGLAGYVEEGNLTYAGMQVAAKALEGHQALLSNFDITDLHVFATASLRNINNTQEALDVIEAQTGLTIDVLSGDTEAQLAFLGAVGTDGCDTGLVADIGGGSVELVAFENRTIQSGCSCPVGSLSLYTKFVSGLFPTTEERRAMKAYVEEELSRAKTRGMTRSHLCGVGGTIRSVAKLAVDMLGKDSQDDILTATEIKTIYRQLKRADRAALDQILHTVPDRVHTILPGFVILNAVLRAYNVETLTLSPAGVREGYLMTRVMGL